MKALKTMFAVVAFSLVLAAGSALAQTAGTQQPPATPPAAQAPAPQAQPPKPFPEGAKIAFVDIQVIASNVGRREGRDREAR